MAYGTTKVDVIQSSTANVPVQFNDGNGTQVGTLCRAWVNISGSATPTIRASFNVSSVTRTAGGQYAIAFTTSLSDANYCINVSVGGGGGSNFGYAIINASNSATLVAPTTAGFTTSSINYNASANPDYPYWNISVFR